MAAIGISASVKRAIAFAAAVALSACGLIADARAQLERLKSLKLDGVEIKDARIIEEGEKYNFGQGEKTAPKTFALVLVDAKEPSKVNIAVALPMPEKWNGEFLAKGNGGAGTRLSVDAAIAGALSGYASAHCNLGTAQWFELSDHTQMVRDFGHEAVAKMTSAGKRIAGEFYGKTPSKTYYFGASTGGQEGLALAERYPELADGIAVFYPVTNRTRLHMRFAFEKRLLAPKNYFTDGEIRRITEALVAQNRGNPGESVPPDRPYLRYPERARADYSKLDFLTEEQREILKKIHSPVTLPDNGEYVTHALPVSCEVADGGKTLKKGFGCWIIEWTLGRGADITKADMRKFMLKMEDEFAAEANVSPNLEKFKKRGGKLLIIQGKLDTIVPAEYVKEYYAELCKKNGGPAKTAEFARLFLVPGGWHSNMSANALGYLKPWVEKGRAPEKISVKIKYGGKTYEEIATPYNPEIQE